MHFSFISFNPPRVYIPYFNSLHVILCLVKLSRITKLHENTSHMSCINVLRYLVITIKRVPVSVEFILELLYTIVYTITMHVSLGKYSYD